MENDSNFNRNCIIFLNTCIFLLINAIFIPSVVLKIYTLTSIDKNESKICGLEYLYLYNAISVLPYIYLYLLTNFIYFKNNIVKNYSIHKKLIIYFSTFLCILTIYITMIYTWVHNNLDIKSLHGSYLNNTIFDQYETCNRDNVRYINKLSYVSFIIDFTIIIVSWIILAILIVAAIIACFCHCVM